MVADDSKVVRVKTSRLLGGGSEALPFVRNHAANAVRVTMTNNGGGRGFPGGGTRGAR